MSTIAGGEKGMIRIKRIDLDIKEPVNTRMSYIRRQGVIKRGGTPGKKRRPCPPSVPTSENLLSSRTIAIKCTNDHYKRVPRIYRYCRISKCSSPGRVRSVRWDLHPPARSGIEFPDSAISHLSRPGIIAICDK